MQEKVYVSDRQVIRVQGSDAASYLHKMTSNDVLNLSVNSGQYNAILDRKGMVVSFFFLFRESVDSFVLILSPILKEKTEQHLQKMKFIQKVTVSDASSEMKVVFYFSENQSIFPEPQVVEFPFPQSMNMQSSMTDEEFELMRIRAGFPEYGVDLDESHILLEISHPKAFVRGKGCYPGQEVIERIATYGKGRTPKSLCQLTAEGDVKFSKTELFDTSGEKVGHVTSSAYDPVQKKTFVLASLNHKHIEAKTITLHQNHWCVQ